MTDNHVPNTERQKASPTNIIFYQDQLLWLDEECLKIKRGGGSVRRTSIIRAIIDFAQSLGVDLSGTNSEEEILRRFNEASGQQQHK